MRGVGVQGAMSAHWSTGPDDIRMQTVAQLNSNEFASCPIKTDEREALHRLAWLNPSESPQRLGLREVRFIYRIL